MAEDNYLAFLRRGPHCGAVGELVTAVWLLSEVLLLLFGSILVAVILHALAEPPTVHLSYQMHGLSEQLSVVAKELSERLKIGSIADVLSDGNAATSIGAVVARVFAWSSTLFGALAGLLLVLLGGI